MLRAAHSRRRPVLIVGWDERQTPEVLGAYQKAEIEKWWPMIKAAGIRNERRVAGIRIVF
jgi:hypothetical protein